MGRHDPRPPRMSGEIRHSEGTNWSSGDSFAYSKSHLNALDRIGVALARYDRCPCDECKADVYARLEEYDRL